MIHSLMNNILKEKTKMKMHCSIPKIVDNFFNLIDKQILERVARGVYALDKLPKASKNRDSAQPSDYATAYTRAIETFRSIETDSRIVL